MHNPTIAQAKMMFLDSIQSPRSANTLQAYRTALETFSNTLSTQGIDAFQYPVAALSEDSVSHFVDYARDLSPATESLYLQVIKNFYEFLDAEHLATVNLSRVRMLIRQRTRRSKAKPGQYPEREIKHLIECMSKLQSVAAVHSREVEVISQQMRDSRDRALILTLADTGLRVDEICKLRTSDMDWATSRAILKGRGYKQAVVRFSTRSINALRDYLTLRAQVHQECDKPITSSPLFARHDKGAGKKIKPVTSTTIRNIVADRVQQILGIGAVGTITPHTFLHYFVTTILRATGNLKLAQVLARHTSIQITQKYAHISDEELNQGYHHIFEKSER